MRCYVYKSAKKTDHYLYLNYEFDVENLADGFPTSLLTLLGDLSLVLEFELAPDRPLAQADPQQVLDDLRSQGFYLQMPKKDLRAEEDRYFS